MKKIFVWGWIVANIVAILYLWFVLTYSTFTQKPVSDMINMNWWLVFILTDLWTTNFFDNLKFPGDKNEGK